MPGAQSLLTANHFEGARKSPSNSTKEENVQSGAASTRAMAVERTSEWCLLSNARV
jgi:hypothetical protein